MTRPLTRAESSRIRRENHRQARQADYAARFGDWGVILAWFEEAKSLAKARQRQGDPGPMVELARTMENFCKRYGR